MGLLGTKITNFVARTAWEACYRRITNYGFSVENPRRLNSGQIAGYFVLGIGQKIKDNLLPAQAAGHRYFNVPARTVAGQAGTTKAIQCQTIYPIDPNQKNFIKAQSVNAGRSGNEYRKPIPKEKLYEKVLGLSSERMFFTREEVARYLEENLGRDYRAPLPTVGRLLGDLFNEGKLERTGEFYHLKSVDPQAEIDKYSLAQGRVRAALYRFKDEIDNSIRQLEECNSNEILRNTLIDNRNSLGFRGVYLYIKINGLKQLVYTSDREMSYKDAQEPKDVMKTVLNGEEILYRVEIGEDLKSALAAFKQVNLAEVDEKWVRESLLANGIGSIDLLKLADENKVPNGILLLRDPIYFGEENQGDVDTHLIKLAKAVGKTVARLEAASERGRTPDQPENGEKPFSQSQYHGGSKIYRSGPFATEYTTRAAKVLRRINRVFEDCQEVVANVTGQDMSRQELEDHLYVEHMFFDHHGGGLAGFAGAEDYTDYIDSRGKIGRLIYYAGIMIRKEFRGGRFAAITHRMMMGIFQGLGWFRLLWKRTPLVYRTQDERIHRLGIRYFQAKKSSEEFNKEDWQAIRFVAEKQKWQMEENTNICRACYSRRMADNAKYIMPGLGEEDGKVCIGYATATSLLKLLWDTYIIKRVKFNGDKPVSSVA
jgi:hypothetical protein